MKFINYLADVTVDPRGRFKFGPEFFQGSFGDVFANVANILIFITGAVSVIMIIIGGFRYVVSGGNPQATKEAKDTILYAVIGVVVAFLAYAIVNFVLTNIIK